VIRTAFVALISHWVRQPFQLLTLILGLALATGLWSAVQAINGEARANYAQAAAQLGTDQQPILSDPDGAIPLSTYIMLRRAGWDVTPVLEGRALLGTAYVSLIGVDLLSFPAPPVPVAGDGAIPPLDALGLPGRLFARPETAALIRGDALPPITETTRVPPGIVMADIAVAERLLNSTGVLTRLLVLREPAPGIAPLSEVAPHLILTRPDAAADTARLTDSFHLNLTAFALLSFAVGLFIVHATAGLAFEQRRRMFTTLRAIGVPLRILGLLVLAEMALLALVAGALGLLIGYLVAAALLPDVAATLRGLYDAPVTGTLTLRPIWFASGLGMALLGALTAGAQGLWRLRQMPLLAAAAARQWSGAGAAQGRLLALIGAGMMVGGIGTVLTVDGLIAGFVFLTGLLLGAALMLPALLNMTIAFAEQRARHVIMQWVWADMRAQLPGLSLALMALMLALATNIGVGTMVSSFRLTFTGWLDQRLASELYVSARSDAQGEQIAAWLEPRVDAVLPIRFGESQIAGQPASIYGVVDHATYRDNWPLLGEQAQVWNKVASGTAALINEQLARRAELWTGDQVTLAPGWTLEIAGVYSDYGNPTGQAIVSMEALLAHIPNVANRRFGVRIAPDKTDALIAGLRENFDLPARGIVNQDALKAVSLRIFEKTFLVTGALNVLTLGVAAFAMLTSLLTLWTMRLPQLAPVWALGLTRGQLARLDVLRSLCLSAITALVALPVGLVLAWALLAVINVASFGWRLPMHVFPLDWLRLFLLALVAGGVAAALPARRLTRMPPRDLLGVFANER